MARLSGKDETPSGHFLGGWWPVGLLLSFPTRERRSLLIARGRGYLLEKPFQAAISTRVIAPQDRSMDSLALPLALQ